MAQMLIDTIKKLIEMEDRREGKDFQRNLNFFMRLKLNSARENFSEYFSLVQANIMPFVQIGEYLHGEFVILFSRFREFMTISERHLLNLHDDVSPQQRNEAIGGFLSCICPIIDFSSSCLEFFVHVIGPRVDKKNIDLYVDQFKNILSECGKINQRDLDNMLDVFGKSFTDILKWGEKEECRILNLIHKTLRNVLYYERVVLVVKYFCQVALNIDKFPGVWKQTHTSQKKISDYRCNDLKRSLEQYNCLFTESPNVAVSKISTYIECCFKIFKEYEYILEDIPVFHEVLFVFQNIPTHVKTDNFLRHPDSIKKYKALAEDLWETTNTILDRASKTGVLCLDSYQSIYNFMLKGLNVKWKHYVRDYITPAVLYFMSNLSVSIINEIVCIETSRDNYNVEDPMWSSNREDQCPCYVI